jgi:hypothetical protein
MDGRAFEHEAPLRRFIKWLYSRTEAPQQRETETFLRIIDEAKSGEWRVTEWAEELGISEQEMLIELDRHLHQPPAA